MSQYKTMTKVFGSKALSSNYELMSARGSGRSGRCQMVDGTEMDTRNLVLLNLKEHSHWRWRNQFIQSTLMRCGWLSIRGMPDVLRLWSIFNCSITRIWHYELNQRGKTPIMP